MSRSRRPDVLATGYGWPDHTLAERRAYEVADQVENHRAANGKTVAERDRPSADGPPPAALRRPYEAALGADLSTVRVHRDAAAAASAAAYGAAAVTFGEDVFLAADAPRPETAEGRRLLGHELTHVVQQRSGRRRVQARPSQHGPFRPWGTPLPGLAVPVSATAVSGIHDWESKYGTATSASNWNVFVAGHYTLQQITVADERGRARVHVYFVTDDDSGDHYAVGPDALGDFVMLHGAGTLAARTRNKDQLDPVEAVVDPRTLPVAPDAWLGQVELYYTAPRLPRPDAVSSAITSDNYMVHAYLRNLPDGGTGVLFWVAENLLSALRAEWVIGARSIDFFTRNVVMYENIAFITYPIAPGAYPPEYSVKSQRYIAGVMAGDVERASEGLGAWKAAATDPGWWLQVVTAYASAATPAPSVRTPPLTVVRGGATAVESAAARTGGAPASLAGAGPARTAVTVGGGARAAAAAELATATVPVATPPATRPVGVPGWNPNPAPVAPRVTPPSPLAAAVTIGAVSSVSGTTPGSQLSPALAPAPAASQGQQRQTASEKVADSNIFQDRVEGGLAQRARIDATVLARPGLTLHVPVSALAEVIASDPHGTQAKRLGGVPGGARILPDLDGDVTPYAADLPKIVSRNFGEADFRIALRARERGIPLVTAQRRLAAQVRDSSFPARVRALFGVVVEHVP